MTTTSTTRRQPNQLAAVLTTADLDRMESDDRWLGFGYLGERRNRREYAATELADRAQTAALVELARMDRDVLEEANVEGLSYDDLLVWANSKAGRWFADCYGTRHAAGYLPTAARVAALRRDQA